MRRQDGGRASLSNTMRSSSRSTSHGLPQSSTPRSRPGTAPSGGRTALERLPAWAQVRESASISNLASFNASVSNVCSPVWDDDGLFEGRSVVLCTADIVMDKRNLSVGSADLRGHQGKTAEHNYF